MNVKKFFTRHIETSVSSLDGKRTRSTILDTNKIVLTTPMSLFVYYCVV